MQPICTHTISVQSKKPSHAYPIIRLPREFRKLIGAKATIFETTHNGDPAFLVLPHRKHKKAQQRLQQPKEDALGHISIVSSTLAAPRSLLTACL
ncbi:MAG: hypothetical protein ACXV76_08340 [Halobacteriota archaeon]